MPEQPLPKNPPAAAASAKGPTPARQRDIRRLAMQTLYLIDATGQLDAPALFEALEEPFDDGETPVPDAPKRPAVDLALACWPHKAAADAEVAALAPDWPTHRQPPVDRAILRLAWYELATHRNDPRIVINEAIELAKQFSNEQAPAFVNGVLDKLAKRYPADAPPTIAPTTPDAWLDDATEH